MCFPFAQGPRSLSPPRGLGRGSRAALPPARPRGVAPPASAARAPPFCPGVGRCFSVPRDPGGCFLARGGRCSPVLSLRFPGPALQVGWPRWRPGWNAPIRRRSRWWLPSESFRGFLESPVPLFFAEWYGFSLNLPLCNDFFFSSSCSQQILALPSQIFFLQRNGSPQLSLLFLVYPSAPILFGVLWILFPFSGFMEIRLTKS